jgi:hypothetical protein
MTSPRPVPRRRSDPDMQNYIYKGNTRRKNPTPKPATPPSDADKNESSETKS